MLYIVIGRRELGKTTMAYYLARQQPDRVIFDPRGMFATDAPTLERATLRTPLQVSSWASGRYALPASLTADAAVGRMDTQYEPDEYVITPDGDPTMTFRRVTQRLAERARKRESFTFLIDEMRFIDKHVQKSDEAFQWVLRCAPRRDVHVIVTGHRPVDIHPDVRAIADHWILFRCTHTSDLELIAEQCGLLCASTVGALAGRQSVHWDDTVGSMTVQRDERVWYVSFDARPASAVE